MRGAICTDTVYKSGLDHTLAVYVRHYSGLVTVSAVTVILSFLLLLVLLLLVLPSALHLHKQVTYKLNVLPVIIIIIRVLDSLPRLHPPAGPPPPPLTHSAPGSLCPALGRPPSCWRSTSGGATPRQAPLCRFSTLGSGEG